MSLSLMRPDYSCLCTVPSVKHGVVSSGTRKLVQIKRMIKDQKDYVDALRTSGKKSVAGPASGRRRVLQDKDPKHTFKSDQNQCPGVTSEPRFQSC